MHPIPSKISNRSLQGPIAFYRKRLRMMDGYGNVSMKTDYDNLMGAIFLVETESDSDSERILNRTKGDAA